MNSAATTYQCSVLVLLLPDGGSKTAGRLQPLVECMITVKRVYLLEGGRKRIIRTTLSLSQPCPVQHSHISILYVSLVNVVAM